MSTRINIRVGEGLIIDLHLQPAACCLITQWTEPGFSEPWRYKIPVSLRGIHYLEGHANIPKLGKRDTKRVIQLVTDYHDQLPF